MDLIDVLKASFRRWYIVLPILLFTGWVAQGFYSAVKPVYYAQSVVGFAPSNVATQYRADGVPVSRNGLLDVGGPTLMMNLAVLGYNDPTVRYQIAAQGGRPNFTVKMFPAAVTGNGAMDQLPLIMIEATEEDPAAAGRTVELATAAADSVLVALQRQAQVPDDQLVHALVASTPTGPVAAIPSRTKTTLYIGLIGVAFALLFAVVTDVLLTRWRSRRQSRSARRRADETPTTDRQTTDQPPTEDRTESDLTADRS